MTNSEQEIKIPTVNNIKYLLEPIFKQLEHIDMQISKNKSSINSIKYYRNNDLKQLFGLSNNTIIKYRETGVLPYTKLGEVYLYDVKVIDSIIKENTVNIKI